MCNRLHANLDLEHIWDATHVTTTRLLLSKATQPTKYKNYRPPFFLAPSLKGGGVGTLLYGSG